MAARPVPVVQELRKTWIDATLVVALMLDDLVGDETVRFANQGDRCDWDRIVQGIGDLAQSIEACFEIFVVLMEGSCSRRGA